MKTIYSLTGMLLLSVCTLANLHAQTKTNAADTTVQQKKVAYQCPMKCEGAKTYDKPGKCPVCGMVLVKQKEEKQKAETYTCSMCGGKFDKPGKCPKCGMKLTKTNK